MSRCQSSTTLANQSDHVLKMKKPETQRSLAGTLKLNSKAAEAAALYEFTGKANLENECRDQKEFSNDFDRSEQAFINKTGYLKNEYGL